MSDWGFEASGRVVVCLFLALSKRRLESVMGALVIRQEGLEGRRDE